MKNKNFLLVLFLIFVQSTLFSQEIFEIKDLVVTNEVEGILSIKKYASEKIIKNKKCVFSENSVEQKLCQFFNLNTKNELVDFFSPYNIPSSYSRKDYMEKMKIYNKNKNFYELDSKYIFDYGISKDIFIKYINHNEVFSKPVYSINYLQDFNKKLYLKEMGENLDIGLFLINSNTSKTISYFDRMKNKKNNISSFCNIFLENIKNRSVKNDLHHLIDKQYSPFFKEKTNKGTKKRGIQDSNIVYSYKKTFHNIISGIVLKKHKTSREEISKKYSIPLGKLAKDSLSVKEVINVNVLNNNFTIIKFYNSELIIKTNYEIVDNNLIRNNTGNLLGILSKLNLEFFVELFVNEKSNKFVEINKIKPLIKNSDGVINIQKLEKVIEKNKKELTKYLE